MKVEEVLNRNDAYHALEAIGGLIRTGPTGTNVNDISVLLILPDGPSDFSEQNKFIK
ncbi:MAG: MOFRL family protein [Eubacteriales bacterium]|nr:MOFRL family protein [Eubacteriales bacterium]